MSEQIDLKTVHLDERSKQTADQRQQNAMNIGASKLTQALNKGIPDIYLSGNTVDGKPFAFNVGRTNGNKIEITGFEFEGEKYKSSKSFEVKEKLDEKDKSLLQDALGSKSVSVSKGGFNLFDTKEIITFNHVGRVSSLDVPEKQGDMKLALAQAAAPASGFKSEHNGTPAAAKPQNSISIG